MATASQSARLTDTDILIDAARRLPQAVDYLAQRQAAGILQISIISAMELIAGCQDKSQLASVQEFLTSIDVLPIKEPISRTAYQLMQTFRLSHGLMLPDALIAATALEHGLSLHTRNVRHFQMIPGLAVEKPYRKS